jgi:uncharacterized protein YeeX (DUF496 family)
MKKITDSELEQIKSVQSDIHEISRLIGNLQLEYETKKADLFNSLNSIQSKRREIQDQLKETYGNVDINIQTGEIME